MYNIHLTCIYIIRYTLYISARKTSRPICYEVNHEDHQILLATFDFKFNTIT